MVGEPVGPPVELAGSVSDCPSNDHRDRVGRARHLILEELLDRARRAGSRRAVAFHSTRIRWRASASLEQGQARRGDGRDQRPRPRAARGNGRRAGRSCPARKRSRRYSIVALSTPSPRLPGRTGSDRTATPTVTKSKPAPARPAAGVLKHEADLEERIRPELAVRLQLLHELLEGHVLVGVRAEVVSRTRPSSSRKVGSPDRSVRSTRVLAKKPTIDSSSRWFRLATACPGRYRSSPV